MSSVGSSTNAAILVKRAASAYNASNFDQAIEHSRAASILLDDLDDETAQVLLDDAFERLTLAYQRIGDFQAASEVVAEWHGRTKREEGRVHACIQQSRVASYVGNYAEAAQLAEKAISMAEAAGYRLGLGAAKRARADLMWKQGQAEEALALGQEALAILETVGDLEQQSGALVTVAAALHYAGRFYKALPYLQRSARIMEQIGYQFELAISYSNLGETYAELYAMDKALEAHQKAMALVGFERAHPDLIRNLGVDLIGVGQEEEGLRHLTIALERSQESNDPDMIAQVLYSLAEADLETGNLDQAQERGNELLAIANKLDSLRHRIRAWMVLGEVARRSGDHTQAHRMFNDCSMAAQRASDRHAIWQTHAALHDLFRASMPQLADIHGRIAAETMNIILHGIEDDELREKFRNAEPVKSVLGAPD